MEPCVSGLMNIHTPYTYSLEKLLVRLFLTVNN